MNNSENKNVDLAKIRRKPEKLVTKPINWTNSKKCKLSTLLFLKQNKQ